MARTEEVVKRILFVLALATGCQGELDSRAPTWRIEEDLRIAEIPVPQDSSNYDLEVALDGTMYLLVPGERVVRYYSRGGSAGSSFKGGSTQFVKPAALGTVTGLLWVYDREARQIVLLSGDGQHNRTVQLQRRSGQDSSSVTFHTMLRDNSMILLERGSGDARITGVRAHPTGGRDTLGSYQASAPGIFFAPLEGMFFAIDNMPATPDSTGFRVTKVNLVGDTLFSRVWRTSSKVVPQAGAQAAFLSPNGQIFIGQPASGGHAIWTVFSKLGDPVALFRVPDGVRVLAAAPDHIYGLERDGDNDVLIRYRIVRN